MLIRKERGGNKTLSRWTIRNPCLPLSLSLDVKSGNELTRQNTAVKNKDNYFNILYKVFNKQAPLSLKNL